MRDRDEDRPRRAGQERRRPYEPPEIVSEEVFETLALACGKKPGQSEICNGAPSSS